MSCLHAVAIAGGSKEGVSVSGKTKMQNQRHEKKRRRKMKAVGVVESTSSQFFFSFFLFFFFFFGKCNFAYASLFVSKYNKHLL